VNFSSCSSLRSFQLIESSTQKGLDAAILENDEKKGVPLIEENSGEANFMNAKIFIGLLLFISFQNVMTVTNTSIIQRQIYGDVSENISRLGATENYLVSTCQAILYSVFPIFGAIGIANYGCYPTLMFSLLTQILVEILLLLFENVYKTFWPCFFCIFISLLTCINIDMIVTTLIFRKVKTQRISTLFAALFISFKCPGLIFFLPSFAETQDSRGLYVALTLINFLLYFLSLISVLWMRKQDSHASDDANKYDAALASSDLVQPLYVSSEIPNQLGEKHQPRFLYDMERIPLRLKGWKAVLGSDFFWFLAFFFAFANCIQYLFKEQVVMLYIKTNLAHFERERNRYIILLIISLFSSAAVGMTVDRYQNRFNVMMGLVTLIVLNFILSICTEGITNHLYHFVLFAIFYGGFYSVFLPIVAMLVGRKAFSLALCIIYTVENFFFSMVDFMLVNSFEALDHNKVGFKVMAGLLMFSSLWLFILKKRRKLDFLEGFFSYQHLERVHT
jgi:hypothetical protein